MGFPVSIFFPLRWTTIKSPRPGSANLSRSLSRGGDIGLARLAGGANSGLTDSSRRFSSGEGCLFVGSWVVVMCAVDVIDSRESVRFSRDEMEDDGPTGWRAATANPKSLAAIASVPRYVCRCAKRLIGGSMTRLVNPTIGEDAEWNTYPLDTLQLYVSRATVQPRDRQIDIHNVPTFPKVAELAQRKTSG